MALEIYPHPNNKPTNTILLLFSMTENALLTHAWALTHIQLAS